jgi:hypothetical protein
MTCIEDVSATLATCTNGPIWGHFFNGDHENSLTVGFGFGHSFSSLNLFWRNFLSHKCREKFSVFESLNGKISMKLLIYRFN